MLKKNRSGRMALALLVLLGAGGGFPLMADSSGEIRIQGANLDKASEVTLDGVAVPFKVTPEGAILVTLSQKPQEGARLVILTPGGRVEQRIKAAQPKAPEDPPLHLSRVSPRSGPAAGGTEVVLEGTGFRRKERALQVLAGGVPVPTVAVNGDGRLTLKLPPHEGGVVDLEVQAKDGSLARLENAFEYVAAPKILGISPDQGPVAGGTRVVIRGSGFALQGELGLRFGKAPVEQILTRSGDALEVILPANTEGPVDLVLTNPDGQTTTLPQGFGYLPAPVIRSLDLSSS